MSPTRIAATAEERRRAFPGDVLLQEAMATWTHGVTIDAPPRSVWPWLAQMGAGRAGWYSWDFLDNDGSPSADALVAGMGTIAVGDVLPAVPGATDAFVVERLEPDRDLVLAVPHGEGGPLATWEFLLDPLPGARTRLLVRSRISPRGLTAPAGAPTRPVEHVLRALARMPRGPMLAFARAGHRVMQARQLRGIRRRAEAHHRGGEAAAGGREARERAEPSAERRSVLRRLVQADSGMNIVGQGARIMLLTAPAVAAAVVANLRAPELVRIPIPGSVLLPIGALLALAGLALWATAVAQLLIGFSRGKLVTSGAYAVCRNPIYSSVALLVLPGTALASGTWGYLAAGAVLCLAVRIFIGKEERELLRVFGEEYRRYTARVHRILPFVRPVRGVA